MNSPKLRAPRPKAPTVDFAGAKAKSAAEGDTGSVMVSTPKPPESAPPEAAKVESPSAIARKFELDLDAEPVSLADLHSALLPGFEPPKWGGAPEATSPTPPGARFDRPPDSTASDLRTMQSLVGGAVADEEPSAPGSIRSALIAPLYTPFAAETADGPVSEEAIQVDSVDLIVTPRPVDTDPPPAVGARPAKPSFFQVSEPPPPPAWPLIFDTEPAPFDPSVPPLPGQIGPAERDPSSGLHDILSLVGMSAPEKEGERADDDLFNLSGGLFGDRAAGPIAPPDLSALIAPVADSARRSSAPPPARRSAPGKPKPIESEHTGLAAPVAPERRTSPAAAAAARRSARAGWVVAIAAIGGSALLLSLKLGQTPAATAPPSETAAVESARPVEPVQTARAEAPRPVETDTPAAEIPGAPKAQVPGATTAALSRPVKDPAPAPTGAAPKAPAIAATAAAVAPPAVTAPPAPTPAVTAPPAGGPEFDRGAAKAALAAAASRAAGCKQPDDPSGGAKVSVTFMPSGRVTSSRVNGPPFQGTPTGGCIATAFRSASVPPFDGDPVTVNTTVSIH